MNDKVKTELINNLKQYKDSLKDYKANITGFPDPSFQESIDAIHGSQDAPEQLAKNLALKPMLSEYLNGSYENHDVNFWIIRNWGKIKFRDEDGYKKRIKKMGELFNEHENSKVSDKDNEIIEHISSLSKVASFVNPERYFIYDSRAIFSLNWLLYKSGEKRDYYYQPAGQGKVMQYYLSDFLNREFGISLPRCVNSITLDMYLDYCNLINELYPEVFDEDKQPYKLEMLLFWIATNGIHSIINDIDNCQEFDKNKYYHPKRSKTNKQTQKPEFPNTISANWNKIKEMIPGLIKDATFNDNTCEIKIKDKGNCVLRLKIYKKRTKGSYQTFGIGNIIDGKEKERIINALKKEFDAKQVDFDGTIFVRNLDTNPSDDNQRIKWFADNIQKIIKIIG